MNQYETYFSQTRPTTIGEHGRRAGLLLLASGDRERDASRERQERTEKTHPRCALCHPRTNAGCGEGSVVLSNYMTSTGCDVIYNVNYNANHSNNVNYNTHYFSDSGSKEK